MNLQLQQLKELVIDITLEEKKTLFRFLSLYLGSLLSLFALIAYLFYLVEYRSNYELLKHQMQMKASNLSAKIIHAHMSNSPYSFELLSKNSKFNIGFYDIDQKVIFSNLKKEINFDKNFYEDNKVFILVDKSAFGHLGIVYTIIEESNFYNIMEDIENKIIIALAIVSILFSIIGYFLAKLFIKPIQLKRIQLDNFIKDSTHELNTPIASLLMSIKPYENMDEKSFNRIKISAKRISDIYKDLTYLFLRNSEQEIKSAKNMVINKILKEQINYLLPLAQKKRLKMKENYYSEISSFIDEESLIRLINNLLSNAIKYNKLDGYIEIITKDQILTIKDSGIGIDKKYSQEIYKRFYRATTESGGFGLGLNIVYKICQMYNIDIQMQSQKDKYTQFVLKFPKKKT